MKPPASDTRYCPGYVIGFVIFFMAVIAAFILLILAVRANDQVAIWRRCGWVLACFGAGFAFVAVYTVWTNKGIGWSSYVFGRSRSGVLDREHTPGRFWLVMAITVLLSSTAIAAGIWLHLNAEGVAQRLSHRVP